jgi:dihydroxyacid dehydratase/phosphogluconate dehydratase
MKQKVPRRIEFDGRPVIAEVNDARMSGTHYGTCVLDVGGSLALVRANRRRDRGDVPSLRFAPANRL